VTWNRRLFSSRPVYRVEIPRTGLGRWWFTYAMPVVGSMLVVLVVVLALGDWLPNTISVGVTDPVTLRVIALAVFVVAYVWQVWLIRRWWRSEDSGFKG
jgi:hypothetical protein